MTTDVQHGVASISTATKPLSYGMHIRKANLYVKSRKENNMELISREDAKRKITEELDSIDHVPSWVFRRLERVINSLPTIEERKEGRWIDDTYIDEAYDIKGVKTWGTKAKCSECGFSKIFIERHSGQYEFCPRCGARMKGADDESNTERD